MLARVRAKRKTYDLKSALGLKMIFKVRSRQLCPKKQSKINSTNFSLKSIHKNSPKKNTSKYS